MDDGIIYVFGCLGVLALCISLVNFVRIPESYYDFPDIPTIPTIPDFIDLENELELWLPFNSLSTNKMYGTTAILTGTVNYISGKMGYCANFNSSGYFHYGNNFNLKLDNFTITCWIKTLNYTGVHQRIFDKTDWVSSYRGLYFYIDYTTGYVRCAFGNGSTANLVSSNSLGLVSVFDDDWHFVVARCDRNTNMNVSSDFVWNTTPKDVSINRDISIENTVNCFIGSDPSGAIKFQGAIDDLRFYNRLLSDYELNCIYNLSQ